MEKIKIFDKEIKYEKVYRNIKYARLEFKTGNLRIILPKNYKDEKTLLKKHRKWIYKKAIFTEKILREAKKARLNFKLGLEEFKRRTKDIVSHLSDKMNVTINNIVFRKMKTKLGSCSSKGELTINSLLRFLPEYLIEYVIFHEVLHRIYRNHGREFNKIMKDKFKNQEQIEEKLLAHWLLVRKNY